MFKPPKGKSFSDTRHWRGAGATVASDAAAGVPGREPGRLRLDSRFL